MVRRIALALLFAFLTSLAAAGDIATFENLGFSQDARIFLFGQYGIDAETSTPYAEIYAVDVDSNSFVPNGSLDTSESIATERPLSLGQDGRGALFSLFHSAGSLIDRYSIDHLNNGRLVYILVDGEEPRERIAFRDFNTNTRFEIVLRQQIRDGADGESGSFHIELTLTDSSDGVRTRTIGRPNYYREGITQYRITQVLLNPDEDAVVIVVEKRDDDGNIRYMVETAPLN